MKLHKFISIGTFGISFWFDTEGFWDEIKWDENETERTYHWLSICTRSRKLLHTDDVYTMLSFVLYPFSINFFIKK